MGIFGSSEESMEVKTVDSVGHVNNNIVIQEAKDVHDQLKTNENMLFAMYFMCSLELIKFGLFIFYKFKKNIKKRYNQQERNANQK